MLERSTELAKKREVIYESPTAIGKFVSAEVAKRKLSAIKFAEEVDVATSTITEVINGKTSSPSLPFLRKLATYTKVPLPVLIALAYPDAADEINEVPAEDLMLAIRLHQLSPALKKAVVTLLNSE